MRFWLPWNPTTDEYYGNFSQKSWRSYDRWPGELLRDDTAPGKRSPATSPKELVARGWDVTLFATRDSVTRAHLHAVVDKGYEEHSGVDPKIGRIPSHLRSFRACC